MVLSFLFLGSPDHSVSTYILLWFVRITTFSLLLRTYFGPWLFALMSDHIRVRSISLWSIRGLYFRKGSRIWKVDKLSYVWSSVQGSRRLAVKIDGVSLEIAKDEDKESKQKARRHNRNLTLADLNPSPLARHAWQFLSAIVGFIEPYFRPIIRTYVIACLRVGIQWLPKITQAVSFDLQSMVITFSDIPGAKIVVGEVNLNTTLALIYLEQDPNSSKLERAEDQQGARVALGMGVWRKRLAESFQRSLDKALGESRGTATMSLKISNIIGSMPRAPLKNPLSRPFLLSRGVIDLGLSAKFNPREGAIDPHGLMFSLRIGDCSANVDILNDLLDKVLPKTAQNTPMVDLPMSTTTSTYRDTPQPSAAYTFASQLTPAFPSPGHSFASSLFSPSSLFSSSESMSPKGGLLSPKSAHPLSPRPFRSPSSPFLQAISASIRPRRRILLQPSVKLTDHKDMSKLLILHTISISVASFGISILSDAETEPHKALITDIAIDLSRSKPSLSPLHKEHLGSRQKTDVYDSDPYALKLTCRQVTLERESHHHTLRLATLGSIDVQVLAFQWPKPFLIPTPFMGNDPNTPFLGIHIKLAGIHMTDRIQDLKRIVNAMQTKERKPENPVPSKPLSFPIPRLSITLECGPISGRVIYDPENGEKHRAVELRSNGFFVYLGSEYKHPTSAIRRSFPAASSVQSLRWDTSLSINLEPILVRVRSKHNFVGLSEPALLTSDQDFLDDPPVISIGAIEIIGTASASAQIDGTPDSNAKIDISTLIFDTSTVFETICIEFWHPISVDATVRLLSLAPLKQEDLTVQTSTPRFLHIPTAVYGKAAVARFVVFITAPDIRPSNNLELSRGFTMRTSAALEYCSLRSKQDHWFNNLQRSRGRTELWLPAETLVDALIAAKSFGLQGDRSAFIKMRLADFVFKAAVATQYEPDEPAIVGREDIPSVLNEILRIGNIQVDICLSCKATIDLLQYTDTCNISVQIPSIRADFRLAHAFSILLGLQTIMVLNPPRPRRKPTPVEINDANSNFVLMVQGNVTGLQALVTLPTQKLVIHIDGLSGQLNPSGPPSVKWMRAATFVSLPPQSNRWETPASAKWDEFMALQTWELSFTKLAGSLLISIDGDSARLRIPHGFVLADLVQDATVSVKAIKHMVHMASAGCYSDMPYPESESPKEVPHLTIRLDCLCVEAQDDPFESRLALIWRTGAEAVKQRMDREEAFMAKVAAILSAEPTFPPTTKNGLEADPEPEYQFTSKHSISIAEARKRLDDVHYLDWTLRLEKSRDRRTKDETSVLHKLCGTSLPPSTDLLLDFLEIPKPSADPPLLRAMLHSLCLTISPPSFSMDRLPDVINEMGNGVPRDSQFSLLVPLHVHFTLSSLHSTLRDYPLPLFDIPTRSDNSSISLTFDTDLIVAEEMGTELSVNWIRCPVIDDNQAVHGEAPFSFMVPKTIMPVKTYATPTIKVTTSDATTFSWGVSYGPAIQDVMRIVETLSSPPHDSSPAIGFWDKMRLVFHWTVKITFFGDVQLYMKGTRDPHHLYDAGSGFVLCWQGNPEIRVGYENQQKELIQVLSDDMLIAVPNLENFDPNRRSLRASSSKPKLFQKVCARLSSGVRYGIGFVLERACGPECLYCTGPAFHRKCRYFSFRAHHEIILEKKLIPPTLKSLDDSYNGFRSDFIHLSLSLACSTKSRDPKGGLKPSNLYLTPKIFAHFWSWCSLFDGVLTLPIRQGSYHPSRPISPKLGRHLATLKYRISLPNLYFMHGYIDDSRETWVDGITPWVGLKGKVDELQADLHQREEESTVPGPIPDTTRVLRNKPFYAAEVILKGLDLRALLATFSESMKQNVQMTAPPQRGNYRNHTNLTTTSSSSLWHDLDDFVELDWSPIDNPSLHLLPFATCPHFTYFKRKEGPFKSQRTSKFGTEHSHMCLLGKEPSIPKTQISLASSRISELHQILDTTPKSHKDHIPINKMVSLLEDYIAVLKEVEIRPDAPHETAAHRYHIPSDIVSSEDWGEFDNVYQIHCPSIFMDSAVRDIMVQYYYCSRDRRGFEYHMAARAVKFIRDQANSALAIEKETNSKDRGPYNTAQIAASALRKILKGDNSTKISVGDIRESTSQAPGKVEPLEGWSEGVSLLKGHCCLLLKPQIVMSGDGTADKCIVAAAQAKLQSFAIMDLLNLDDPISGKVMSRNYTSLSGLQAFAPTTIGISGNGSVPLEVLIDLRCESNNFERLVPQTEAIFHYDKFNRLRLRNNITSIPTRTTTQSPSGINDSHLQDQTDLIRVHIPRFTVSANTEHFQAISNIVTKLLLFSDPAHKIRLDRLETLIFTYDFTDIASAANVVSNLQSRLRDALETERTMRNSRRLEDEEGLLKLLQLKSHIFLLSEELNLLFDSIKMAQDRFDDQTDQKSALLLHASSAEISWRMLDARRNLLSKLAVANINFHWLSRQDSSTVNHLTIGNLSAFDGSRYAMWAEILSKYDDPPNHPLLKRGLFLLANWTILAPVGGITIYETFELSLHPLRLQIDAKVGRRIMEYVWPDREKGQTSTDDSPEKERIPAPPLEIRVKSPTSPAARSSIDSPRGLHAPKRGMDLNGQTPLPTLRRLGSSRSFTDLRSAIDNGPLNLPTFPSPQGFLSPPAFLKRTPSSDSVNFSSMLEAASVPGTSHTVDQEDINAPDRKLLDDAHIMKTRSSQKSFVMVRISSLHLLLSVVKEGSFECHDARIKTRELDYRNQTWSFEELVNQFIPSNMSWRGWVKMAFHQPLVPVLPVARELLSKTRWTSSKSTNQPHDNPLRLLHPRLLATDDDHRLNSMIHVQPLKKPETPAKTSRRNPSKNSKDTPLVLTSLPLTAEPEAMIEPDNPSSPDRGTGRKRVKSLFSKNTVLSSKDRGPNTRQSEDTLQGS